MNKAFFDKFAKKKTKYINDFNPAVGICSSYTI